MWCNGFLVPSVVAPTATLNSNPVNLLCTSPDTLALVDVFQFVANVGLNADQSTSLVVMQCHPVVTGKPGFIWLSPVIIELSLAKSVVYRALVEFTLKAINTRKDCR